jgi:hypothetical protein
MFLVVLSANDGMAPQTDTLINVGKTLRTQKHNSRHRRALIFAVELLGDSQMYTGYTSVASGTMRLATLLPTENG